MSLYFYQIGDADQQSYSSIVVYAHWCLMMHPLNVLSLWEWDVLLTVRSSATVIPAPDRPQQPMNDVDSNLMKKIQASNLMTGLAELMLLFVIKLRGLQSKNNQSSCAFFFFFISHKNERLVSFF